MSDCLKDSDFNNFTNFTFLYYRFIDICILKCRIIENIIYYVILC